MSKRSAISLADAVTRNPVDAVLVDEVSDDELRAADHAWVLIRYQTAIEAINRGEQHAPTRTGSGRTRPALRGTVVASWASNRKARCRL